MLLSISLRKRTRYLRNALDAALPVGFSDFPSLSSYQFGKSSSGLPLVILLFEFQTWKRVDFKSPQTLTIVQSRQFRQTLERMCLLSSNQSMSKRELSLSLDLPSMR